MEPSGGFNANADGGSTNRMLVPQHSFLGLGVPNLHGGSSAGGGSGGADEIDADFKILANLLTEEGKYGGGECSNGGTSLARWLFRRRTGTK